ncbi:ABC transporter permease [Paenibacillus bouchesdurhonensis]|uniref:ABC transporter permease n=1 Tax=Paenibacillus bouchesdurhonensis TaxID=1870990 RepID=UPI000DA60B29|nr:ABC transporter permease [Paenibacillus bouchesdurhonensis]
MIDLSFIYNFFKYTELLKQLVIRDLKVKYRHSILGIFWSILNPLLTMVVISIVFSNLFRFDIENFAVYFMSASLLFSFFSEATTVAMTSVIGGASLISKVYIPKYLFPLSKCLSSFVHLMLSFAALLIIMFSTGIRINYTIFAIPLIFVLILVFSIGISLILSSVSVFFRDMTHLYSVLTLMLMYMTPIFYPASIVPEKFKFIHDFNPLFYYVESFREIILEQRLPSLDYVIICSIMSFAALIIGLYVFYKRQDKFILHL